MRPIDKFREYNKNRKLKAIENKIDYKALYDIEVIENTKLINRLRSSENHEAYLEAKLAGIKKRSIAPLDVTSILNHHKQIDTKTVKAMIKKILGDLC